MFHVYYTSVQESQKEPQMNGLLRFDAPVTISPLNSTPYWNLLLHLVSKNPSQ
jgi:hypothetical protein